MSESEQEDDKTNEEIKKAKILRRFAEVTKKFLSVLNFVYAEKGQLEEKQDKMEKKEFLIPVFDGEDYAMWKKRITMFMKMKKCDTVLTREKAATDEPTWDEYDLKAINIIYSSISNKQLEFVCEETTAYGIMRKLDCLYLKESTALQIVCRNRLEKMRLNKYSETASFFNDFEKSVNELKAAGAQISEKEKLNYMLNTLPESYSYIGDLIDTLKVEDQTADYVKSKIKMAEMKNQNDHLERRSNAFVTVKGNCYKCGKTGHFARECQNGSQTAQSGGTWRGSTRGRSNRRGMRGNFTRGRGNYRQQPETSATRGQDSSGTSVWIATAHTKYSRETYRTRDSEIEWLLDSGCTDHIMNDDRYFEKSITLEKPVNIYLGDNRHIKATKIGNVVSYFNAFGTSNKVNISNVFYAKEMNANLISFGKLIDKNTIVAKEDTVKIIDKKGKIIAVAYKENQVLKMKSKVECNKTWVHNAERNNNNNNITQKERWHRILGHVNFSYLNILCSQQLLEGIPDKLETGFMKCKTCIENKMHNLPFQNNRLKANDILEIIHTDVCGSFKTAGPNGERYFVSFIDDYSKIAKVYCIKSKDEVFDCMVNYINEVENLTEKRVKKIRCDNGKEYLNNRFYKYAKNKGIFINNCPVYVHELNGTAERFNRTIMDMARCLLDEAQVHKKYWPEIICAATYLKNRSLTNTIEKKTPYEIFFRKRPNVRHLKLYGSKVFVRKPEQKRLSKWDKKADMGILLGYSDVGYRVLINNRIIVTRHVDIVEKNIKCINLNEGEPDYLVPSVSTLESSRGVDSDHENNVNDNVFESADEDDEVKTDKENVSLKTPRRSTRDRRSPIRYPENSSNNIFVNYCRVDTPYTFEEAINSDDSKNWEIAMNQEIDCINRNETWKLVNKVKEKKILDVKWVYTRKLDDRYKARLVVRGFQQTDVVDDIYAPVAKNQTLKILLSYCCKNSLKIEQMDVETAFLNGKVKTEVYVHQPKGYEDGTNRVYKLSKALYGLRESPRDWYECFDECITKVGFKRSNADLCLYKKGNENDEIYVLIYVDDLLICSKSKGKILSIKKLLMDRFKMKELGEIKEYLGVNIDYNYRKKELTLSQMKYIELLADKYKIQNSKLYSTPMETNLKLEKAGSCESNIKYRNLIGALLYIGSSTRPDISYSVNYLSRYQNNYNETHWKYALRILKYLYLTKDLVLYYKKNVNCDIINCYVDADWAGDNIDRKSTSGYVIKLFGNVIDWKSRKQKCITKASTYAEYVALSEVVSEIKYIRELVKIFDIEIKEPIKIYEDNSGAINIANNGNFTKNSKHIEIQYHFVHESVKEKLIDIQKIDSNENVADIFTKALSKEKFEKFRSNLNVVCNNKENK